MTLRAVRPAGSEDTMILMRIIVGLASSALLALQAYAGQSTDGGLHLPVVAQKADAKRVSTAARLAATDSQEGPKSDFVVFDATSYHQKPDLSRYGLRPVFMVAPAMIWPSDRHGDPLPDRGLVRRAALQAAKSNGIAVLDIEHWSLTGDPSVVQASIKKYETLIQWFKMAAPSVTVGYYGVAPTRNYWAAFQPKDSPKYIAWQAVNDREAPIARLGDILLPSVYTFYEDREGWVQYAIQQIQEARRYGGNKPVYVFLWQQYHASNQKLAGTYLPPEFWRLQLETARKYADGVVIWGEYDDTWNETAPWWLETKSFLERIGANRR